MTSKVDKINMQMTGTFELRTIAKIMRQYKEGSLKLSDAIWEMILTSK